MIANDPAVPAEATAAFHACEKALMTDDLEAMGDLFRDSPQRDLVSPMGNTS